PRPRKGPPPPLRRSVTESADEAGPGADQQVGRGRAVTESPQARIEFQDYLVLFVDVLRQRRRLRELTSISRRAKASSGSTPRSTPNRTGCRSFQVRREHGYATSDEPMSSTASFRIR